MDALPHEVSSRHIIMADNIGNNLFILKISLICNIERGCGQNPGLPWAPKGAEKICFHKKKSIRP